MADKAMLQRLDELAQRNEHLEQRIQRVHQVLSNLIQWTAQSAGSPISRVDAKMLLDDLHQ